MCLLSVGLKVLGSSGFVGFFFFFLFGWFGGSCVYFPCTKGHLTLCFNKSFIPYQNLEVLKHESTNENPESRFAVKLVNKRPKKKKK
jgi:hypothetical protein